MVMQRVIVFIKGQENSRECKTTPSSAGHLHMESSANNNKIFFFLKARDALKTSQNPFVYFSIICVVVDVLKRHASHLSDVIVFCERSIIDSIWALRV